MIPSAPLRSAVWKPFWICCGEPSVAIVFADQPSCEAAWATILPCIWHAAAPQLMNTSFLPDGTALPTGLETVMSVGRLVAAATTVFAWSSAAVPVGFAEALLPLELCVLELPPEPHPAAATSATIASEAMPYRLRADVSGDIPPSSL